MSRKVQNLMISLCFLVLVVGAIDAKTDDATLRAHFEKIRQVVWCKFDYYYYYYLLRQFRDIYTTPYSKLIHHYTNLVTWRLKLSDNIQPSTCIVLGRHIRSIQVYWKLRFKGYNWAPPWKNLFMPYANNKSADQPQPAHPRSLINVFVVRCLHSIISLVSISEISSL